MFLPLGDENPTRNVPVVTWILIAANVAVFLLFNVKMSDPELMRWTLQWGYDVDHPYSRQLLTSMFMHAGVAHLLGNMWVLWIVGDNVEDRAGRIKYALLYVLGGIAAALSYMVVARMAETSPEIMAQIGRRHPPLVGASGAIAAVMGMYLVFFPEARIRCLIWFQVVPIRAKWFLGLTLGLDLVTSVLSHGASAGGVATMAHVGGGVFGILAAMIVKPMLGGGGEGDAWEVHTGWSRRQRPGVEPWQDTRLPPAARVAPPETDEIALEDVERSITLLVRDGRVREAIDVYPAYVAMAREQPLPDDVQIEIAHEFYRQWLPREAIPAYTRYLETHPGGEDVAEAKFRLGVLYARGLGRRDEAGKWLREAVREHPDAQIRDAAAKMLVQIGA
jgi:membrane associated rhomboid family serine protease